MNHIEPTRFSYHDLFSIARELRHQAPRFELTPPLRRKLEQSVVDLEGEHSELSERIMLRRMIREQQLAEVLHGIRSSTCQYCCRRGELVTYTLKRVTGFLSCYRFLEQTELACRSCARGRLAKSSLFSLVAGWWSLSGARATPYAVFTNLRTIVLELSDVEVRWLFRAGRTVRSSFSELAD